MPVPQITDNFTGSVNRVTLGATKNKGGTRTSTITVGGAQNVVCCGSPEQKGEKPLIAIEVIDIKPQDLTYTLIESGCA